MKQNHKPQSIPANAEPPCKHGSCCHHPDEHEEEQEHHQHDHDEACCTQGETKRESSVVLEGATRVRYRIEQMDCPTEENLIRKKLQGLSGVVQLDFNLISRELTVFHRLQDPAVLTEALRKLDMAPVLIEAGSLAKGVPSSLERKHKWLLVGGGISAIAAEVIASTTDHDTSWVIFTLSAVSILCTGLPTLKKGWIAVKNFSINIFFLMSLAVSGAIAIGKWPEAAMVVFLFAIAEAIEAFSLERARNAIKSLAALAPETAEVQVGNEWTETKVDAVSIGALIRVRTGSRVPLDARVVSGQAALNQAPITGESLPVDKAPGDNLYAGSIVMDGVVEATVTAVAEHSTLAKIAAAIQSAQSQRAPTQRFVDQFARYYTPAVVVFAVVMALLGPPIFGGTWLSWFYQALVMLVIACPCALVISTPVTVVSGLARAARKGILIKGGAYLESGRLLKAVALDKTGTLTHGRPELSDVVTLGPLTESEALMIAASLDDQSTHPVAQALVKGWKQRQPNDALLKVENFRVLMGRGVRGTINGSEWSLGNLRLVHELKIDASGIGDVMATMERLGKTAVILCSASEPVAVFAVSDTVRKESGDAIEVLKKLGIKPIMLTGDNVAAARTIADQLGIEDVKGNLLPEDKQNAIVELARKYGPIGMVGDGINDAPALARADVGFAMGAAGTATALETADVAIMDDDPRKVAAFIRLSQRTSNILKQNIGLALSIKVIFFALALSGHATLWMAVFADTGASLLVVFNGLRLLAWAA